MALKLKGSTSGFVGLDAPAVAGNNTLILPENSGSAFQVFANDITAGVTTFTQVTVSRNGDLTVPGTISIGGTLTYEDVTSVDSIGIVTARGLSIFGNTSGLNVTGVGTFAGGSISLTSGGAERLNIGSPGGGHVLINNPTNARIAFGTNDIERLRITAAGLVGIGTITPQGSLDVRDASGSDPTMFVGHSNADVEGEFLRVGRTDIPSIRYHSIKAKHGGASANNYIAFTIHDAVTSTTSQTEVLRVVGNNRVGINTDVVDDTLHIFKHEANHGIKLERSGNLSGSATLGVSSNGVLALTADNNIQYTSGGSQQHIFYKGSDEIARFDTSRRLLIRSTSSRAVGGSTHRLLQVESTDAASGIGLIRNTANAIGSYVSLGKSRASSVGGTTIVQDGDTLGIINFAGADGTDISSIAAEIRGKVDGTPGSNVMPGSLEFRTTPAGSDSSTTRMTIGSDGNIHFGTTGTLNNSNTVSIIPADGRISFGMDGRTSLVTGESGAYIFSGQGSSGSPLAGELILQSRSNVDRDIFFATGASPTFRARFRGSDGDFFLGNDLAVITNVGTAFRENDGSLQSYMEMGHSATGANYSYFICRHGNSGTNIGGIAQNSSGNGVTFNTSSDYRLKENVVNITDGITRIKQLTPRRFNWISDETNTLQDGFIAHEVSSIVPEAITGEKDAVETTYYEEEKNLPEGKSVGDIKEADRPVYQAIDQSKLVPLLTAALQEEIAKREALEARVAALEG